MSQPTSSPEGTQAPARRRAKSASSEAVAANTVLVLLAMGLFAYVGFNIADALGVRYDGLLAYARPFGLAVIGVAGLVVARNAITR